MLLNCGIREDSWEPLGPQGDPTSQSQRKSVLNIHWKDWCWSSSTLATWCEELTHWKRPWCWKRLKAGGEADDRGWDGWMASPTRWTWVEPAPGVGDGQGSLACCSPWGHEELDMTEWLNWTEPRKSRASVAMSSGFRRDFPHLSHRTWEGREAPEKWGFRVSAMWAHPGPVLRMSRPVSSSAALSGGTFSCASLFPILTFSPWRTGCW